MSGPTEEIEDLQHEVKILRRQLKAEQQRIIELEETANEHDDLLEMEREISDSRDAQVDLLVSRLCAIAFDAGLNGERLLGGWDLSGGFYGFKGNVTLSAEEAER